jgi:hypothetical protein
VLGAAACAALAAGSAAAATVSYDNFPSPLPGNVQSQAFEATQAAEFGGLVQFAGSAARNPKITVGMSSWACQSGGAEDGSCVSAPGATYEEPITLNVYSVGAGGGVGTKLVTFTQTFAIPYRPTADPSCPTGGWRDLRRRGGGCFHGKLFKINFAKLGNNHAVVTLPEQVIISVAFNAFTSGYFPIGIAGPYDSLNVAMTQPQNEGEAVAPSVGTDPAPANAYYNSDTGQFYCDKGAGGTGTFRLDAGCRSGEQPLIEVKST